MIPDILRFLAQKIKKNLILMNCLIFKKVDNEKIAVSTFILKTFYKNVYISKIV